MTDKLDQLRDMLAADGYRLHVEQGALATRARITADDGVCGDCLVPPVVLSGMIAAALDVPVETVDVEYPTTAH